MKHSLTSWRDRRAPWAAILAVACAGLIEAGVLLFVPAPGPPDLLAHRFYPPGVRPGAWESLIQWQLYHATLLREPQEVVFLGDSTCPCSLRSVLFGELTGTATWNFGLNGFLYSDGHADAWAFWLKHQPAPRLLVYHISPGMLFRTAAEAGAVAYRSHFREWLKLDEPGIMPSLNFHTSALHATARLNGTAYSAELLTQSRGPWPSDDGLRSELWERRGSLTDPQPMAWRAPLGFSTGLIPESIPGIRRICRLAAERGTDVLLVVQPSPESARCAELDLRYVNMQEGLIGLAREFGGIRVFEPTTRYYPDHLFVTSTHLNDQGAERNTRELADWYLATYGRAGSDSKPSKSDSRGALSRVSLRLPAFTEPRPGTAERPREAVSPAVALLPASDSTR